VLGWIRTVVSIWEAHRFVGFKGMNGVCYMAMAFGA
jgi:hypothetical protein